MPSAAGSASADAHAVARRLHEVTEDARQSFSVIAAEHAVSVPQARLLLRLVEPTPMSDLAEHLACDPSNVTGIAARLIERGIVTTLSGRDRRVKLLVLTGPGRCLRDALELQIVNTSPAMTRLTKAERQILLALLSKLIATDETART